MKDRMESLRAALRKVMSHAWQIQGQQSRNYTLVGAIRPDIFFSMGGQMLASQLS